MPKSRQLKQKMKQVVSDVEQKLNAEDTAPRNLPLIDMNQLINLPEFSDLLAKMEMMQCTIKRQNDRITNLENAINEPSESNDTETEYEHPIVPPPTEFCDEEEQEDDDLLILNRIEDYEGLKYYYAMSLLTEMRAKYILSENVNPDNGYISRPFGDFENKDNINELPGGLDHDNLKILPQKGPDHHKRFDDCYNKLEKYCTSPHFGEHTDELIQIYNQYGSKTTCYPAITVDIGDYYRSEIGTHQHTAKIMNSFNETNVILLRDRLSARKEQPMSEYKQTDIIHEDTSKGHQAYKLQIQEAAGKITYPFHKLFSEPPAFHRGSKSSTDPKFIYYRTVEDYDLPENRIY